MKVVLGDNHPSTLGTMSDLALSYGRQESTAMLRYYSSSAQLNRKSTRRKAFQYFEYYGKLSKIIINKVSIAKAEVLYKQYLDAQKAVVGENHPNTPDTANNLANACVYQVREAEVIYKQCFDARKIVLGESHPSTLKT